MARIVPVKNSVLCRKVDQDCNVECSGILVKEKRLDIYEVLDIATDEDIGISKGDLITVEGNGDEVEFEGKPYSIFMTNHVSSKIIQKAED